MRCGVVRRHGSDVVLLWLWHRPAAVAPIRPLAWEPPCATGAALERQKKKRKCSCVLQFCKFQCLVLKLSSVKAKHFISLHCIVCEPAYILVVLRGLSCGQWCDHVI